jgi:hypothetical protein
VIIHDLHIVGIPVVPDEADAVLIVNPNAVLSAPVAREGLEPVAWEGCQITEFLGCIQLLELPLSDPSHPLEPAAEPAREERLSVGVVERPNHFLKQAITSGVTRQAVWSMLTFVLDQLKSV